MRRPVFFLAHFPSQITPCFAAEESFSWYSLFIYRAARVRHDLSHRSRAQTLRKESERRGAMLTSLTSTKHGLSVAAANRNRAIESKARRDKKNRPSQAQFGRLALICFTRSRRETLCEKYERVGSPRLAKAQKNSPPILLEAGASG